MKFEFSSKLINYTRAISKYWSVARSLSNGRIIPLWITLLMVPFHNRLYKNSIHQIRVFLGGKWHNLYIRDGLDISTLHEIFVLEEYNTSSLIDFVPNMIADLGGHIGAAAIYFRIKFPNAKIISYEPDPENFSLLKRNVEEFSGIECYQAAAAPKDGEKRFFKHSGGSTRGSLRIDPDSTISIIVPAISFGNIVSKGVDFVKFDIEGGEYDLFSQTDINILNRVPLYLGEYHSSLTGKTLEQFGNIFKQFKVISNGGLVILKRNL